MRGLRRKKNEELNMSDMARVIIFYLKERVNDIKRVNEYV